MTVYVESEDELGALAMKLLTEDVITNLAISRSVVDVREYIDLEVPIFYIEVVPTKRIPRVEVKDVLTVKETGTGCFDVEIVNERYAPQLLELMWSEFGEDNVHQIERNRLKLTKINLEDIMNLPIGEMKKNELMTVIRDMIFRIVPIGFRVIRNLSNDDKIAYIASENPILDEQIQWIEDNVLSRQPRELSIDRTELIPERETKPRRIVTYKEDII